MKLTQEQADKLNEICSSTADYICQFNTGSVHLIVQQSVAKAIEKAFEVVKYKGE